MSVEQWFGVGANENKYISMHPYFQVEATNNGKEIVHHCSTGCQACYVQ